MSSPAAPRAVSIVAFTLLLFFVGTAWSQTYVNRVWHYPPGEPPYYTIEDKTYASSIAWTAAGGPYVCEAHVTVASGVLLTVESGALVEFVEGMGLYIEGDIQANGATFTRAGERYWRGIYLSPNSNASSLVGCTIRHAGGVGYCYNGCSGLGTYNGAKRFTSVYIDACSPVITGCVIEESWSNGIEVWRGGATIENNQFHNLGADSYALVVDVTDTYPQLAGNIASGTGFHGVSAPPGRWMSSGAWRKPGASFPYFLRDSMAVESGATLTLAPGVEVRAEGNIGVYVRGALQAVGSPGNPVVFTSRKTSPSQGDWNGIYLGPGAGGSVLSQCRILYAGGLGVCYYGCRGLGFYHGADRFAAVYIDGSAPQLLQCEIHHSYSNGIEAYGANPALIGISIQDCRENGLRMEADSHPTISNSALMSNGSAGYYAVTQDASSTAEPNSVTFGGNTLEGVEIRGGRILAPSIWRKWAPNAPYVMTGNTTLDPSAVLAIDPGVAVKTPDSTVGLYCHGVVIADGTPEPIVFASADPTAVSEKWSGIYLGPQAGGSLLHFCSILHAGSWNWWTGLGNYHGSVRYTSLYFDNCSPMVACCTIGKTASGIEMYNSGALILSSVIFDSAGMGILCEGGSTPSILNNTVAENTRNGATGIAAVGSSPILSNNIVAFNGTGISQMGGGTVALANNCVYGNGTDYSGLAPGATDRSEDPLFAGSAEGDFHLTSKSQCINAGLDEMTPPVTEDRDGKARPLGNHTDIGAYEYGESETTVFEFGGAWCATGWHGLFDLNLNGEVDVEDLILLLRRWK